MEEFRLRRMVRHGLIAPRSHWSFAIMPNDPLSGQSGEYRCGRWRTMLSAGVHESEAPSGRPASGEGSVELSNYLRSRWGILLIAVPAITGAILFAATKPPERFDAIGIVSVTPPDAIESSQFSTGPFVADFRSMLTSTAVEDAVEDALVAVGAEPPGPASATGGLNGGALVQVGITASTPEAAELAIRTAVAESLAALNRQNVERAEVVAAARAAEAEAAQSALTDFATREPGPGRRGRVRPAQRRPARDPQRGGRQPRQPRIARLARRETCGARPVWSAAARMAASRGFAPNGGHGERLGQCRIEPRPRPGRQHRRTEPGRVGHGDAGGSGDRPSTRRSGRCGRGLRGGRRGDGDGPQSCTRTIEAVRDTRQTSDIDAPLSMIANGDQSAEPGPGIADISRCTRTIEAVRDTRQLRHRRPALDGLRTATNPPQPDPASPTSPAAPRRSKRSATPANSDIDAPLSMVANGDQSAERDPASPTSPAAPRRSRRSATPANSDIDAPHSMIANSDQSADRDPASPTSRRCTQTIEAVHDTRQLRHRRPALDDCERRPIRRTGPGIADISRSHPDDRGGPRHPPTPTSTPRSRSATPANADIDTPPHLPTSTPPVSIRHRRPAVDPTCDTATHIRRTGPANLRHRHPLSATPANSDIDTPLSSDIDTPLSSDIDTPLSSATPANSDIDTPLSSDIDTPLSSDIDTPLSSATPANSDIDTPLSSDIDTPLSSDDRHPDLIRHRHPALIRDTRQLRHRHPALIRDTRQLRHRHPALIRHRHPAHHPTSTPRSHPNRHPASSDIDTPLSSATPANSDIDAPLSMIANGDQSAEQDPASRTSPASAASNSGRPTATGAPASAGKNVKRGATRPKRPRSTAQAHIPYLGRVINSHNPVSGDVVVPFRPILRSVVKNTLSACASLTYGWFMIPPQSSLRIDLDGSTWVANAVRVAARRATGCRSGTSKESPTAPIGVEPFALTLNYHGVFRRGIDLGAWLSGSGTIGTPPRRRRLRRPATIESSRSAVHGSRRRNASHASSGRSAPSPT